MNHVEHTEKAIDAIVDEFMPNWYARQGMAHEFITTDQAREIANAIAATQ